MIDPSGFTSLMILLRFGDIYALGTKAYQQVCQEWCYRCAQMPSTQLGSGGAGQCVASRGLSIYGHFYMCQDVKKVGSIAL